jgi:hypothetical protein
MSAKKIHYLMVCAGIAVASFATANAQSVIHHVTNGDDDGPGSLRFAIAQADSGDVVRFVSANMIITLTSGQLVIDKSLTIEGQLGTVRRDTSGMAFRIFRIDSGATVKISELTIAYGKDTVFVQVNGSGILNYGNLILEKCKITKNTADELYSDGGGVYNSGVLSLAECEISENKANGAGAGIYNRGRMAMTGCGIRANISAFDGGGILNDSTLVIANCTIANNSALNGGGIANLDSLRLANCKVDSNTSEGEGGGIRNVGVLQFAEGEINHNRAGRGGSLFNFGQAVFDTVTANENTATFGGAFYNDGILTLYKANVAGNQADSSGGAIANLDSLRLNHCAVTGNLAASDGGGLWQTDLLSRAAILHSTFAGNKSLGQGGGIHGGGGAINLNHTIVALNDNPSTPDISGDLTSQTFNLIGNTGTTIFVATICDLVGASTNPIDPLFVENPEAAPTITGDFDIQLGSPAYNAGKPDTTGLNLPATDLGDKPRVVDDRIDIGAFESKGLEGAAGGQVITVTSETEDEPLSLRQAIAIARDGDIIIFESEVKTVELTLGTLVIDKHLSIHGGGRVTIRGLGPESPDIFGIFRIEPRATVRITGVTITKGLGAIENNGTLTLSGSVITKNSNGNPAGGLINHGNATIANSTLSKNYGSRGGSIFNDSTLALIDCTIDSNIAFIGPGIYNVGTLKVYNSAITRNVPYEDFFDPGAGIWNNGKASLTDCIISGNVSTGFGAELSNDVAGDLTATGCTINEGRFREPAVFNAGKIKLIDCTISENQGPGIDNSGISNLVGCVIADNSITFSFEATAPGLRNTGSMSLDDCTIRGNSSSITTGNHAGGILNSGTLSLKNCAVKGNQALSGDGGIRNDGHAEIINSTVSGNGANGSQSVGGLSNLGTLSVINATISGNRGDFAGGVANDGGTANLMNSIIALNESPELPDITDGITSRGYNLIGNEGGATFDENVGDLVGTPEMPVDPRFVQNAPPAPSAEGDFRLRSDSPAINAGNPDTTGLNLPDFDLAGNPRVLDDRIDMGAFEFVATQFIRVSGKVLYCSPNGSGDPDKPVAGLNVILSGNEAPTDTIRTDSTGVYVLDNLPAGNNYRVQIKRSEGGIDFAITPTDALLAFHAYLGKIQLNGCQSLAADVDSSLSIQPSDALLIFNRFLGFHPRFPVDDWRVFSADYPIDASPQAWRETPEAVIDFSRVFADITDQNFHAVVRGDVNLDWQPPAKQAQMLTQQMMALEKNTEAPVELSLTRGQEDPKTELLTLQVQIDGEALQPGLNSFGAELRYDPEVLEIIKTRWGESMPATGFETGHNVVAEAKLSNELTSLLKDNVFSGKVRFGGFGISGAAIKQSGVLFEIKARILKKPGSGASQPVQLLAASATAVSQNAPGFSAVEVAIANQPLQLASIPTEFALEPNYPNPFNPTTKIRYQLPEAGDVKLTIFNMLGQKVRSLVHEQNQAAGFYHVAWDGRDDLGRAVTSGVYFYRIEARTPARSFVFTRKMTFLK